MADKDIPVVRDNGGRPQSSTSASRWWKEKDPGPAMVEAGKKIYESPSERARRRADLVFARLHSGRPLSNIYDYGSAFRVPYASDPWGFGWKIPLNIVQAVIEAIASKIAKNKPRALFLTEGGDYTLQRQAKGMTKYLDGLNRQTKLFKKSRRIFRDSGAFGTGIWSLYEDMRKVTIGVDRTLPVELVVDEMEAARGEPQTIYEKVPVYREVLLDLYGEKPEARAIIEGAEGYNPAGADGRMSEMLPVWKGWHLNGMHCISLEEGTLHQEDWEFDWFPKVMLKWREPDSGIWGLGAAENLLGIQYEISQMLERFQRAMKLGAKMWVFMPPTGGPQKGHMTNENMTLIPAETAPTFATPNPMPEQAYRYLWDLWGKGFELEGVSQLTATGTKPAGLDAAVALREFNDLNTERFVIIGQDQEDCFVEIAEKEVKLSKRMLKRGKSIVVRAPDTKTIARIDFDKVDLDEERSTIGIFPTSSLPTTPAARLQTVKEYYESGLIPDRETALSLLDFPDLAEALSLELSAIDDVKRILENILDKGKYEAPEPYMNLQLALRMTQSAYLRARNDGVPEKRRDLLLRFIDEVQDTITDMGQQQGPAAPQQLAQQPAVAQPQLPAADPNAALPPAMPLPAGTSSAAIPSELPA